MENKSLPDELFVVICQNYDTSNVVAIYQDQGKAEGLADEMNKDAAAYVYYSVDNCYSNY